MANQEHIAILDDDVEAWNQWRRENPHVKPDLGGAMFWEASLHGANLAGASLQGAYLGESDLTDADFRWADLTGANLSETFLAGANLTGAVLRGANLKRSQLLDTNFSRADLAYVNLENAICVLSLFIDVDLSKVKGLDTIRHYGPSYIDLNTLAISKGTIPTSFLKGCGLEESFLTYAATIRGGSLTRYQSCFISYSENDTAFAELLYNRLQGIGIRCWLDDEQMKICNDIFGGLHGSFVPYRVLLCASKSSLTNTWLERELDILFAHEAKSKGTDREAITLITLNLDGFISHPDFASGKKRAIQSRIAANFQGWESDNALFEREMEKVIKALRTDAGRESPPPQKL